MHREHIADHTVGHQLAHLGAVRRVAVVKAHPHLAAGTLGRVDDLLSLGGVHRHGLFGNDVAAQLNRADNIAVVRAVNAGDDDAIGLKLANHIVKAVGGVGRQGGQVVLFLQDAVGIRHTRMVDVAQRHQSAGLRKLPGDRLVKEARSAADAHLYISFALHGLLL